MENHLRASLALAASTARRLMGHTVVRNAALLYFVQISSYLFPLIALPYLSRVLSTENFGMVAYAQTFTLYFVTLTEYGFNLTATRSVAVVRDDLEEVSRIFSAVMVAKLLLTILGFLILCICLLTVPIVRAYSNLFLIAFLSTVGYLLFPSWLYQGLQKMRNVAIRDFLAKLVSIVVLLTLVRSDRDYLLAAAAQSGGLLIAGLIDLLSARQQLGVRFHWPSRADVWKQFTIGWPAFFSLAVSTAGAVTNTVIVGLRAPVSEVAYFSASYRIIGTLRSLVTPISTAVYPHASQKAVHSEINTIRFVAKYALPFTAPFLVAGVVLFAASPWCVRILLGSKYDQASTLLRIMAFVPALLSFTQVYSTYYMLACGYDKAWMRIILTSVLINFVSLGLTLGLVRGSIALATTALVTEGSATFLYWRFYRQRSREVMALG